MLLLLIIVCVLAIIWYIKKTQKSNIESNKEWIERELYEVSSEFDYNSDLFVYVNDIRKEIMLFSSRNNQRSIIPFERIIGMDVFEDGKTMNGVDRAIIGGALFDAPGAVVGAITAKEFIDRLQIVIYTRDVNNPNYTYDLIYTTVKVESAKYRKTVDFCRRLKGTINAIVESR